MLVLAVWIVDRVGGSSQGRGHVALPAVALPAVAARPSQPYVTPSPDAVWNAKGYQIRPCGVPPAGSPTFFTAAAIAGRPGGEGYSRTDVIDAGQLDLRDGRLWVTGGEYLPYLDDAVGVATPAGTFPVTLLTAQSKFGPETAAVLVEFTPKAPVRWVEVAEAGGGTDGGQMALAGVAAASRLASVRDAGASMQDIDNAPEYWLSPCLRYSLSSEPGNGVALTVNLQGDGGFPGAVGYDFSGAETAVVVSTGLLPWSLLGLPGLPPPEAVRDEPTPSASSVGG
ncbi:MAG: hypothetical protein QOG69_2453 [Actinomycetota bacterium]|nr:hypothetical protein [Actinomycetota bacterium]